MHKYFFVAAVLFFAACSNPAKQNPATPGAHNADSIMKTPDISAILAKKEVPVLCYHHIRKKAGGNPDYAVSPAAFAEQMKVLADSGYKTVLPDDIYEYLVHDHKLPAKPVMISFDDTDEEQFTVGKTEMDKYGFKGVYFIMTISINRKRYMTKEQLKQLSDEGHVIAAHTWDHHKVTDYKDADWDTQFIKPRRQLEAITGKPINYFAFPFGIWDSTSLVQLKTRGYKLAFILSGKRDSTEPLYTLRRMIVPGNWTTRGMLKAMKTTFHQ